VQSPQKTKNRLLYDPQYHYQGYTRRNVSGYNKGTCISIYTAALFTIVKPWKQPRCSTTDE
jgi:hypothetical protein